MKLRLAVLALSCIACDGYRLVAPPPDRPSTLLANLAAEQADSVVLTLDATFVRGTAPDGSLFVVPDTTIRVDAEVVRPLASRMLTPLEWRYEWRGARRPDGAPSAHLEGVREEGRRTVTLDLPLPVRAGPLVASRDSAGRVLLRVTQTLNPALLPASVVWRMSVGSDCRAPGLAISEGSGSADAAVVVAPDASGRMPAARACYLAVATYRVDTGDGRAQVAVRTLIEWVIDQR